MQKEKKLIGFIGQGWIGKHYADDFENRGHDIIRYGLEEPHVNNKEKIKDCDIVFIAVPTPSTPEGFDDSIVRSAISLINRGSVAVIKSTILPGTVESIQIDYPDVYVMHSPEFLREASAAHDSANPDRNIIGIPEMSDRYKEKARDVISVLPNAPYEKICSAREAELVKYGGNCFLFFKVLFNNMLYDLSRETGCKWEVIRDAMIGDPRIGKSHMDPIHQSGRGAGGHCFIKDFSAFTEMYEKEVGNEFGIKALEALRNKNIHLLANSEKDLDLLYGVYGEKFVNSLK